jgi:hypothetical protein
LSDSCLRASVLPCLLLPFFPSQVRASVLSHFRLSVPPSYLPRFLPCFRVSFRASFGTSFRTLFHSSVLTHSHTHTTCMCVFLLPSALLPFSGSLCHAGCAISKNA